VSIDKDFLLIQDMILAKTSIEKALLHVNSRNEKTVYSWVQRELSGFFRKYSKNKDLANDIIKIQECISKEDYICLKQQLLSTKKKIEDQIDLLYKSMYRRAS